ncbi:UNVERIFIED_CONTAM: hypothetical protein GTU68_001479 [Idotea baltica]|nr:hypothetical protein [Idotea baltica]
MYRWVNAVIELEINFGRSFRMSMASIQQALTSGIQTFSFRGLMYIIMKLRVANIFLVRSVQTWNPELLIQSELGRMGSCLGKIVLCLARQEQEITGLEDITLTVLNSWILFWMQLENKFKVVTPYRDSKSLNHWEGGLGQEWALSSFQS